MKGKINLGGISGGMDEKKKYRVKGYSELEHASAVGSLGLCVDVDCDSGLEVDGEVILKDQRAF